MKVSFKTLQHLTFSLELEPEMTVAELKDKIEKDHGKEYAAKSLKLIYSGKILADTDKLSEYKFEEKKFVVVMTTRPPPPPPSAQPAAAASTQEASSNVASVNTPQSKKNQTSVSQNKPSQLTTASSQAAAITQTQQQAQQTTSSSSSTTRSSTATTHPQQPSPETRQSNQQSHHESISVRDRLAILSSQPEFRQLQHLVQQNPHLLSTTIEALADSNPELYTMISENPELFLSALSQPITESQRSLQGQGRSTGVLDLISNITQEDKEAIGRLKELGFSEDMAAQAYMACNKDEQLAANLLFQMDQ